MLSDMFDSCNRHQWQVSADLHWHRTVSFLVPALTTSGSARLTVCSPMQGWQASISPISDASKTARRKDAVYTHRSRDDCLFVVTSLVVNPQISQYYLNPVLLSRITINNTSRDIPIIILLLVNVLCDFWLCFFVNVFKYSFLLL